jgi:hypothetical protein
MLSAIVIISMLQSQHSGPKMIHRDEIYQRFDTIAYVIPAKSVFNESHRVTWVTEKNFIANTSEMNTTPRTKVAGFRALISKYKTKTWGEFSVIQYNSPKPFTYREVEYLMGSGAFGKGIELVTGVEVSHRMKGARHIVFHSQDRSQNESLLKIADILLDNLVPVKALKEYSDTRPL